MYWGEIGSISQSQPCCTNASETREIFVQRISVARCAESYPQLAMTEMAVGRRAPRGRSRLEALLTAYIGSGAWDSEQGLLSRCSVIEQEALGWFKTHANLSVASSRTAPGFSSNGCSTQKTSREIHEVSIPPEPQYPPQSTTEQHVCPAGNLGRRCHD